MSRLPKVSIGMPVRNGEPFLEEAVQSIRLQTYTDFQLVISDNASEDGTEAICRRLAAGDERIRYYRNPRNIGAARNFNRVFDLSAGEYFKWAAHDDLLAPNFLERCVEVQERDASVVLCYPRTWIIDAEGVRTGEITTRLEGGVSSNPVARFGDLVLIDHLCTPIFGLIRRCVLRETGLLASHIASDRNLLAELGLRGRFHEVPEYLFFSRDYPGRSIRAEPFHLRAQWFDPDRAGTTALPHWRMYSEYFKSVNRVPLERGDRIGCWLNLLRWPWVNLNWARLLADLIIAAFPRSMDAVWAARGRLIKDSR